MQLELVQKVHLRASFEELGGGADLAEPGHGAGLGETSRTRRQAPASRTRAVSDPGAPAHHSSCPSRSDGCGILMGSVVLHTHHFSFVTF